MRNITTTREIVSGPSHLHDLLKEELRESMILFVDDNPDITSDDIKGYIRVLLKNNTGRLEEAKEVKDGSRKSNPEGYYFIKSQKQYLHKYLKGVSERRLKKVNELMESYKQLVATALREEHALLHADFIETGTKQD